MNGTTQAFARTGMLLLQLVARLAIETKGTFPAGPAATVLAMAIAYSDAARNAFAVLAVSPSLGPEARSRVAEIGSQFRAALGVIATRMPGQHSPSALPSLAGLVGQESEGIGQFFRAGKAGPVSVTEQGRHALLMLRRDVLILADEGEAALMANIEAVVAGVQVTP